MVQGPGLGFGVEELGFRVWGLGFGVQPKVCCSVSRGGGHTYSLHCSSFLGIPSKNP